jgi:glycosyltransferase involved in cell wall biosynthesis
MTKVSINDISYHEGYHYELMKHPPEGVHYSLEKSKQCIPIDAIYNEPSDKWERFIQFAPFPPTSVYSIPYLQKSKQLIHSYGRPIIDNIPYLLDLDMFFYPYLVDTKEFERIKRLETAWPAISRLTLKEKLRLKRSKELLGSPFCKKILPWSKWCRDYIRGLIDEQEIREKVELLYPAVHNATVCKKKNKKKIRLLYIGTNDFHRKGGSDILRAFDILRHVYKSLELVFIGSMPQNIYQQYQGCKNIRIYNYLPKKQLFSIYRESDIFSSPTRHDSFGISLLEAMSFSLPVITTKGRSVPVAEEIVDDGVSGFLIKRKYGNGYNQICGDIDFGDFMHKLMLLIEDKKLRERMGEAGKYQIAHGKFSIRKRNERLRKIYEEALRC